MEVYRHTDGSPPHGFLASAHGYELWAKQRQISIFSRSLEQLFYSKHRNHLKKELSMQKIGRYMVSNANRTISVSIQLEDLTETEENDTW